MTGLRPSATPRLVAYAVVGIGALLAAVAAGRPELAALGAPFALLATVGVVVGERPRVTARLALPERVVEGDDLTGTLHVDVVGSGRAEVLLDAGGALAAPARLGGVVGAGASELPVVLRAARWGVGRAGPLHVRASGPLGLVRWHGHVPVAAAVRVLPTPATLRRLVPPDDARAAAGAHLVRRRGDGIELAEVRPYGAGDLLRSVNWRASARRGGLWVNQRHPERSADVVVLLDTFADAADAPSPALERSVRAAWAVAAAHLRRHDRVGVVGFGGYPTWLAPGGGERARYAVLDKLLGAHAAYTEAPRSLRHLPAAAVPPGAGVIALTPLHDRRTVDALVELRRRGHRVTVVHVDVRDLLPLAVHPAADRLWSLELRRRVDVLAVAGAPVVPWPSDGDIGAALEALPRRGPLLPARPGRGA